jgi:hypothetical protein
MKIGPLLRNYWENLKQENRRLKAIEEKKRQAKVAKKAELEIEENRRRQENTLKVPVLTVAHPVDLRLPRYGLVIAIIIFAVMAVGMIGGSLNKRVFSGKYKQHEYGENYVAAVDSTIGVGFDVVWDFRADGTLQRKGNLIASVDSKVRLEPRDELGTWKFDGGKIVATVSTKTIMFHLDPSGGLFDAKFKQLEKLPE